MSGPTPDGVGAGLLGATPDGVGAECLARHLTVLERVCLAQRLTCSRALVITIRMRARDLCSRMLRRWMSRSRTRIKTSRTPATCEFARADDGVPDSPRGARRDRDHRRAQKCREPCQGLAERNLAALLRGGGRRSPELFEERPGLASLELMRESRRASTCARVRAPALRSPRALPALCAATSRAQTMHAAWRSILESFRVRFATVVEAGVIAIARGSKRCTTRTGCCGARRARS